MKKTSYPSLFLPHVWNHYDGNHSYFAFDLLDTS